jgi:D-alanyl-D-alanine carboxypeptidase (penicillin-binding protein 5/6)
VIEALALVVALGSPSLHPLPVPPPPIVVFPDRPPPELVAASWMIYAVDEAAPLASRDPDRRLAPASITKLLTAMIAEERADPGAVTTISANADATPIGFEGQPDVRQGEQWLVEELFANILVQSGNDAAVALAEHVAGSVDAFVALMNDEAAALGMEDSTFLNPNGLDATGHLSTARDLIKLGVAALDYPLVMRTARIKHIDFRPPPSGRLIEVDATNRLLGVFPEYLGLKTGDTLAAGQVLLSYVRGPQQRLVAVVLASTQRRIDTRELMAWGVSALGPRDRFFHHAVGTDLEEQFPSWYVTRIAAAGPLPIPEARATPQTPREIEVLDGFRDLLPALLGGSGS